MFTVHGKAFSSTKYRPHYRLNYGLSLSLYFSLSQILTTIFQDGSYKDSSQSDIYPYRSSRRCHRGYHNPYQNASGEEGGKKAASKQRVPATSNHSMGISRLPPETGAGRLPDRHAESDEERGCPGMIEQPYISFIPFMKFLLIGRDGPGGRHCIHCSFVDVFFCVPILRFK